MKKIFYTILLAALLLPQINNAQNSAAGNKLYYGMDIGFNFGNYFRIRFAPLIGYNLSPKFSIGGKIAYEYIKDKRYSDAVTYNNYGGSIFSRYIIIPQLYAHAEFSYMSYQYSINQFDSERSGVPFLLLGGGYRQQISKSAYAFAEVLFDVLQDSKSPYNAWEPVISVGVTSGF